jgi:hypothetical protein
MIVPSQIVTYIDHRYPQVAEGKAFYLGRDHAPVLAHLLQLIDRLPETLITFQRDALAEFGEAVESMRAAVNAWNGGDNQYKFEKIPDRKGVNPLVFIRSHLATLRDDLAGPAAPELSFISDKDLRETLRTDIASANRSLSVADWKGCTVLAGSVVEALLLWVLEDYEGKKPGEVQVTAKILVSNSVFKQAAPSDLSFWNLHQLTEVCRHMKLITETTAAQCRIAKEFRNLIHPGRASRLSQRCNLGTALSALAAVEHVIGDLSL